MLEKISDILFAIMGVSFSVVAVLIAVLLITVLCGAGEGTLVVIVLLLICAGAISLLAGGASVLISMIDTFLWRW